MSQVQTSIVCIEDRVLISVVWIGEMYGGLVSVSMYCVESIQCVLCVIVGVGYLFTSFRYTFFTFLLFKLVFTFFVTFFLNFFDCF